MRPQDILRGNADVRGNAEVRAQPSVVPYDPARPALITAKMQEMQSADVNTRVRAFSYLRDAPGDVVERAWRTARAALPPVGYEMDCLERLHVKTASLPIAAGKRAIVTVATPGYETQLGAMLGSIRRFAQTEATIVVFAAGSTAAWVKAHYPFAAVVECELAAPASAAVKAVLYSCARWVEADTILALEADMLVLSPLAPLYAAAEALRSGVLSGCRSQVEAERFPLRQVFGHMHCPESDWQWLTGGSEGVHGKFSFNGGLLIGSRSAWAALDASIRELGPRAVLWGEGAFYEGFRDELLMNLCLARSGDTAELPATWNVQFCDANRSAWLQTEQATDGMHYTRLGETARGLHFVGAQRCFMADVLGEIEQHGLSAVHG